MQDKNKRRFSKQDMVVIAVLIFLLIGILAISPFLPDERPDAIRKELIKQGYEVKSVDFEYVMDGEGYREWIYQSSVPIYYKGYYVDQWSISGYSFTTPFIHYYVRPYLPLAEPVSLRITFTPEELERISESANDQPIEEYIKYIINDSIEAGAGKEL